MLTVGRLGEGSDARRRGRPRGFRRIQDLEEEPLTAFLMVERRDVGARTRTSSLDLRVRSSHRYPAI